MARPAISKRPSRLTLHSGPSAPEWNFCSQIVQPLTAADSRKNGASHRTRCHDSYRSIHQAQSSKATGSMTVDGLLSRASRAKTTAPA